MNKGRMFSMRVNWTRGGRRFGVHLAILPSHGSASKGPFTISAWGVIGRSGRRRKKEDPDTVENAIDAHEVSNGRFWKA